MREKRRAKKKPESADTGFGCEAVFFQRIVFEAVAPADVPSNSPSDTLSVGWDWAWLSRDVFDVNFTINIAPSNLRPESMSLTAIGRFRVRGVATSVSVENFARFSGPAILMPYVRQHITLLTAAGQAGPLVLPPLNVQVMMERMDPNAVTAAGQSRPK